MPHVLCFSKKRTAWNLNLGSINIETLFLSGISMIDVTFSSFYQSHGYVRKGYIGINNFIAVDVMT